MSGSKKQVAANQVRSLRAMRKKAFAMATHWEDLDQFNLNRLEELADFIENVAVDITAADEGNES
jgi:hypothetical protein